MLNMQIILGHLGGDPEMRYTPSGAPVTTFSVASNYSYSKADGQKIKETEWFSVQSWNKLAEVCAKWLKKGALVVVIGRTKTQTWNGEDGQKHSRKIVVAERVIFVDLKDGVAEQSDLGGAGAVEGTPSSDEGDIPF